MKTFAISLYDNEAESDDELTFKANDLLQVLQYDYLGMDGWYLCKLVKTNRVGLAAGNRLKVISDEKQLLAKFNSLLTQSPTKANKIANLNSSISSIFSTCSSNVSNLSSSNVSSPIEPLVSNEMTINSLDQLDFVKIDQSSSLVTQKSQPKLVLPAKNSGNLIKLQLNCKTSSSSNDTLKSKGKLENNNNVFDNHDDDDDDYDYDIPENNKPTANLDETSQIESAINNVKIENAPDETAATTLNESNSKDLCDHQMSRKSASPTIDSGISTSSLISLNSEHFLSISSSLPSSSNENSANTSSSTSSTNRSSTTSNEIVAQSRVFTNQQLLENEFKEKLEKLYSLCTRVKIQADQIKTSSDLTETKTHITHIKHLYEEFLIKVLKRIKQEHASFHPDLNVFNKFKTNYRQLKEFYLFYETRLSNLNKVLKWDYDLIIESKETNFSNEFTDLNAKLPYMLQLLDACKNIVNENCLFQYQQETTLQQVDYLKNDERDNGENDSYGYEYDNNDNDGHYAHIDENEEQTYENDADYCDIDELGSEPTPPIKNENQTKRESGMCLTLKKNDEKIRREIRLATSSNESEKNRITMCDQMLLKFYLKHIEENLNELKQIFEVLNQELDAKSLMNPEVNEMANKLALNGHKLLFICDTLERNLNNKSLKQTLSESSMSLCEALQLYMIRLKSTTLSPVNSTKDNTLLIKQNQIMKDSLLSVFSSANNFKHNILKYYFKSF